MARIKSGPSGLYYDENDNGPDQGTPEEIAAFKAKQAGTTTPTAGTADGPQRQTTDPNAPGYDPGAAGPTKLNDWLMNKPMEYGAGGTGSFDEAAAGRDSAVSVASNGAPSTTAATTPAPASPQGGYAFMEGVDTAKMNDPNHTTPKYIAARILASGGSLEDAAKSVGARVIGPDTMVLPTGETIDTRRDIEGANQLQWLVTNDPNAPIASKPNPTMGSAIGAAGSGLAGLFGGGGSGGTGTASRLFDYIMGKAGQSLDVNAKDPIIAGQVNAFDAANQRASRDYLRQLAEKGGPINNLGQETRMMAEKRGQNLGTFQGQLMQQELMTRRNEIMQALQMGANFMTDQQKLALQQQLMQMDNALAYARLGQQAYEFDTNDEFRRSPLAS